MHASCLAEGHFRGLEVAVRQGIRPAGRRPVAEQQLRQSIAVTFGNAMWCLDNILRTFSDPNRSQIKFYAANCGNFSSIWKSKNRQTAPRGLVEQSSNGK